MEKLRIYVNSMFLFLTIIVCYGLSGKPNNSCTSTRGLSIKERSFQNNSLVRDTFPKVSDLIIGAIRWDAWHNPDRGFAAREVEYSLSQKKYHWRAPFFSNIINDTAISITGYTQEVVDREIEYASEMGLDYWAFLLYDENSPLSDGINYYVNSDKKDKISFCAMVNPARSFLTDVQESERLIRYINEPTYLKVNGNRPLIYFFRPTNEFINSIGGENVLKEKLRMFCEKIKEAGFAEPFKVIMHYDQNIGLEMYNTFGADALSTYAIWGDNGEKGNNYQRLMEQCEQFWDSYNESGHKVIPTLMAGWDRRPRIERPVSWEAHEQKPGVGMDKYFELPTNDQLVQHFVQGIEWVMKNDYEDQARIILIYAWNEHDEGGWLCPTLNENGTINTERLETIKKILKR